MTSAEKIRAFTGVVSTIFLVYIAILLQPVGIFFKSMNLCAEKVAEAKREGKVGLTKNQKLALKLKSLSSCYTGRGFVYD